MVYLSSYVYMYRELGEWAGGPDDEEDDDKYVITEDDDLPFACYICRDGFR